MAKKNKYILFIILFMGVSGIAHSEKLPTPEELVLLMRAASERYRTFDASLTTKAYYINQGSEEIIYKQKIDFRLSKDKNKLFSRKDSFKYKSELLSKTDHSSASDKKHTSRTITSFAWTPKYTKTMIERSHMKRIDGYVSGVQSTSTSKAFTSIDDAMWSLFAWPYDKINFNQASVTYEKDIYILKAKLGDNPNGPQIVLHIDPSKGYIPIEKKLLRPEGTVLFRYQLSDFRETPDGCYIPYSYIFTNPEKNFSVEHLVQKVELNKPIPDDLLTFTFKDGTSVYDENMSMRYTIGGAPDFSSIDDTSGMVELSLNENGVLEPITITRKIPEEEALQETLKKTKELVRFPSKVDKKSGGINSFKKLSFIILLIISVGLIMMIIIMFFRRVILIKKQ